MIEGLDERLRAALGAKNMTIVDCAKQTKLTASTIGSYITRGSDPSATKLAKIASCLGVSADWLLGLSTVMRTEKVEARKEAERPKVKIITKTIIVSPCMTDDEIEELIAEYLGWTPEAIRAQHNSRKHRFKWVRTR